MHELYVISYIIKICYAINYTLDCMLYYKLYITIQMWIIYLFFIASAKYWSQIIITSV